MSQTKLKGKVAIVTGGARGIGKAICERLAADGASLAIVDIQQDVVNETVEEFKKLGIDAKAYVANIADTKAVKELIKSVVNDFEKIDILINNAGITRDNLIMRMKEEEWDAVITVNLKGTFNCIQAVSRPMMKKRTGKIINVASIVGVMGNAGQANYSAAKGGVIALTKTAAKELAPRNINVNAVAPGFIQTDMTGKLTDEAKAMFLDNIPLKRAGSVDDVSSVIAFLASDDSDYITGQTINIDGGLVM
ncbi:MAG: 3-oxoacyl-[acyl-carrier-protein] reductase [Verrucomicrobiota bacterium]|nr:3-oxoacyl-[acyl-carrier-protein] reductase [Verrucomicrobiota bacterium]